MSSHVGSCHCGAVKVHTELDPILTGQCNCTSCRKLSGSVVFGGFYVKDEIVFTHDELLKSYEYVGGSRGKMTRFVCPHCFSPVALEIEVFPGFIGVSAGIFDDAENFAPNYEVFTRSKLPFLSDNGCIKNRYGDNPIQDEISLLMKALEER